MKQTIWEILKEHKLELYDLPDLFDEEHVRKVYLFWQLWGKLAGFFSKSDLERILDRHLYESLIYIRSAFRIYESMASSTVSCETKIIDVGSGPGLPGLLIPAWKTEKLSVTLMDSSRRRLSVVEENFKPRNNISFLYARAEDIAESFDLVMSRAFIPFPICVETIARLTVLQGLYLMSAGQDPLLETPGGQGNISSYLRELGFVSHETKKLDKLEFLGQRNIVVLKKEFETAKMYPRPWIQIKESLSKWKK